MSSQSVAQAKVSEPPQSKASLTPHIPANRQLPEITVKATILGIILAIVMSGANAYLGLKIGLTVSATIPAAVISMAILRFFRTSNILENNIVQTTASAGEVIAAGTVFTLPALIMLNYWTDFPFWQTTVILGVGGSLGVLFSIPLRRALVVESKELKFPEGIATGEVLKIGADSSAGGAKDLLLGGVGAALVKFAQSGLMVLSEGAHYWTKASGTVFGFGTGFPLVLVGAGYIVGINVGLTMLLGGVIAWCVGVPLYGFLDGVPEGLEAHAAAATIWNDKIRMLGVGTMIVGGLWTVVLLVKPIRRAITISLAAVRQARSGEKIEIERTEHDMPINWVFWGITVLIAPLAGLFYYVIAGQELIIPATQFWFSIGAITAFAVVIGFVASAIGGYMSGLLGSSNTPLSGVTIMVILLVSFMLYSLLGDSESASMETSTAIGLASVAIIIGAVVACAAAVSCDNLQDLKAGLLVGATPWKQQVMLLVGVVAGSLVMAPVLQVLFEAYGIGGVFPREGMDPSQSLGAPKAAIMADISRGVFMHSLDWTMILFGAALGVVVVILDEILKARGSFWRFPAIALAIGIYMPLDVTVPLFIGGLIWLMAEKRLDRQRETFGVDYTLAANFARRRGLLFSSGLIAGEAIMGIVLAIPFATYQTTTLFSIAPEGFESTATALGAVCMGAFALYLYRASSAAQLKA